MKDFLSAVLAAYVKDGVEELSLDKLNNIVQVKYGSITDAKRRLGDIPTIRAAFIDVQKALFAN